MTPRDREQAKVLATEAGCTSARLRLGEGADWDQEALRVARLVEREALRLLEAAEAVRVRGWLGDYWR